MTAPANEESMNLENAKEILRNVPEFFKQTIQTVPGGIGYQLGRASGFIKGFAAGEKRMRERAAELVLSKIGRYCYQNHQHGTVHCEDYGCPNIKQWSAGIRALPLESEPMSGEGV